jgi:hypothetical protein
MSIVSATNKFSVILVLSFLLLAIVLPSASLANTVVLTGPAVSITQDQTVEGDFYGLSQSVSISGLITDDALLAGGKVTVNGTIGEDAFITGGYVDVLGPVADDLRVIGGYVTIGDTVAGDLFVVGGTVKLLSTASIEGDVLIYGGEVVLEGSVGGDVLGTMSNLTLNSFIGKDVNVTVANLQLRDQAEVAGGLTYSSYSQLYRAANAIVTGDIVWNDPVDVGEVSGGHMGLLVFLTTIIFSVLTWYLLARKSLNQIVELAIQASFKPFAIGFAWFCLAPIVAGILLVSVVGVVLGMALLFAYLISIVAALILLPAVFGQLLMSLFTKVPGKLSILTILIGVLVIGLLTELPVLGAIIIVILLLISLGAFLLCLRTRLKD